jgi:hypothetical protein
VSKPGHKGGLPRRVGPVLVRGSIERHPKLDLAYPAASFAPKAPFSFDRCVALYVFADPIMPRVIASDVFLKLGRRVSVQERICDGKLGIVAVDFDCPT